MSAQLHYHNLKQARQREALYFNSPLQIIAIIVASPTKTPGQSAHQSAHLHRNNETHKSEHERAACCSTQLLPGFCNKFSNDVLRVNPCTSEPFTTIGLVERYTTPYRCAGSDTREKPDSALTSVAPH